MYEKISKIVMGLLIVGSMLFFYFSGRSQQGFNNDLVKRIEAERTAYIELNERTVEELQSIGSQLRDSLDRVGRIETELTEIKSIIGDGLDTTVGVGITSDRNLQIVDELRRRFGEGSEK